MTPAAAFVVVLAVCAAVLLTYLHWRETHPEDYPRRSPEDTFRGRLGIALGLIEGPFVPGPRRLPVPLHRVVVRLGLSWCDGTRCELEWCRDLAGMDT